MQRVTSSRCIADTTTWDPTQPVATRPLAIQKDGTWRTYGLDLTKNVCEVFGATGYIRTAYTYTPFGEVTASGSVTQPIQWSSEFHDPELGMVYYNWRYYNTINSCWITRDKDDIEPLYCYIHNKPVQFIDLLGNRMEIPWDEYIEKELAKHKSEKPKKRIERFLAYGCVGVVAAALGRYPTSGRCYVTNDTTKTISKPKNIGDVEEIAKTFAHNNGLDISKLVYFSIHLYLPPENNQRRF